MTELVEKVPVKETDDEDERRGSNVSMDSSTSSSKLRPSLRGSAKFKRISSAANSSSSMEDKMLALNALLSDSLLITEFRNGEGSRHSKSDADDDDTLKDEFGDDVSDDDFEELPEDGRVSKDDYDTDLDMDYDEWINEEKREIENDKTGEKKYLHICEETGVIPASYFLNNIQEKEFTMKYHGLGPNGAKAIAWPLKTNKKIEKINLEGNWIEAEGSIYLAKMLKNNIYVTELHLAENRIGNEGAEAISDMLQKNDMIYSLDLSGNNIEDYGAEKICRMLLKNSSIKHLYLANNNFEERAAGWLREVLITNETLETVDLSWNHLRTRGAVAIAEGVQENYGLRVLNLAMNGFAQDGSEAMGKALKNNRTLLELDLSHNRIPEAGAAAISQGLQHNDTLKVLRMASNPLGGDGPLQLLNVISNNDMSEIRVLDLTDVLVTPAFKELQETLEKERILTVHYGNIVGEVFDFSSIRYDDPFCEFRRDPMSLLIEYCKDAGYRLVDLFHDFDRDGNHLISKEEFIMGIKKAGVKISIRQLEILMEGLDLNKDGSIEYSELVIGEKEHTKKKMKLAAEAKKSGRNVSSTQLIDEDYLKRMINENYA
ncbi:leucine-rich repeat-containing protein 74B-like isoform X2 [Saccostrea echinata]|uniref:leucine-rich repeat-containing protein 74B-like isoform X2 n=1 Tax=Saccostrea echinata TaxID=191078 RepID=UPI002A808212|nr:leucine-rich repeat-containing protein 74B-like isoform X2 [Saccostrea echinata]